MKAQQRLLPVFKSAALVTENAEKQARINVKSLLLILIRLKGFWLELEIRNLKKERPFFYRSEKVSYRIETDLNRTRISFFR